MGARLPNLSAIIQAGIDPKTRLPIKFINQSEGNFKPLIKRFLNIIDEQDAVNRYVWYNLPKGLDGQLIERILYYKAQGAFFYMKENDTFYFLPYALEGSIDVYGRFKGITPLPFGNGTIGGGKDSEVKPWINGLVKLPQYEVIEDEELKIDLFDNACVLLHDFTKQRSEINIPRQVIQEPVLDLMAECIPFLRTKLINSTGVQGLRVNDEDQQASAKLASRSVVQASLDGEKWIPVVGNLEFQDLGDGATAGSEEFLEVMQALDNFRLSAYGIDNGGLFQKKTYQTDAQNSLNDSNIGLVYQDGLTIRQKFCDIVNSIWGLNIYCEPSESIVGYDMGGDGLVADTQDQSGAMQGEQPDMEEVEDV